MQRSRAPQSPHRGSRNASCLKTSLALESSPTVLSTAKHCEYDMRHRGRAGSAMFGVSAGKLGFPVTPRLMYGYPSRDAKI